MIASSPSGVKPDTDDDRLLPSKPRIAWFSGLVYAVENGDSAARMAATRELRQLGYSVCLLAFKSGVVRP